MIFSCIIPASQQDLKSEKLEDLISSIRAQDFPQDQIEILVITEGDSEQAKAIGIKRAQGEICAMFCADNYVPDKNIFSIVYNLLRSTASTGVYGRFYAINKNDNSLNRYFSLIGNNDPIAYYLGKCDRNSWNSYDEKLRYSAVCFDEKVPSLGDNGFFYRREHIIQSNLDNYYPMDNAEDLRRLGLKWYIRMELPTVWHRTSDNLLTFLKKRYRYARDLYCDRTDRRWKMLDTREDYWKLCCFVIATLSIVPCLYVSCKGFSKVKDGAWFWHWPVCFGFLITYGLLACRNLLKYRSLSRLFSVQTA